MARRRMVPTHFFKDPDIMSLSRDEQLILLGLILFADDEGREVAHAGVLGREVDYPAETIEAALCALVANDLLALYQAGRHRYYQLTRWKQWQTLGGHITPSRYPAPGGDVTPVPDEAEPPSLVGEKSGKSRGKSPNLPRTIESNLTESNLTEDEEKQAEHLPTEACKPENVLLFPTLDADGGRLTREETTRPEIGGTLEKLAKVLRVDVSEALSRLATEFADVPLLGEADAARAWCDEQQRQGKKQLLTLPFFRRWLQKSRSIQAQQQVTSATGVASHATGTTGQAGPPRLPNLMHLDDDLKPRKGVNTHE